MGAPLVLKLWVRVPCVPKGEDSIEQSLDLVV